jgi:hypothetical protein
LFTTLDDQTDAELKSEVTIEGDDLFTYTDPKPDFTGHEACIGSSSAEWINDFSPAPTAHNPINPDPRSFHPELAGMSSYSTEVHNHWSTATK